MMANAFSTGGVIGLGGIGGGVAKCLQRSGQLSAIYDVRAESAANVPGAPAMSVSPRDLAAASDCVLIAVLNGAQTIAVLSGPDGVLAAKKPGQMVILLSTISMNDLETSQKLCADAGVTLLDCGVTGGPKSGENGLICLAGGSDADMAAAKPIFDGFAGSVISDLVSNTSLIRTSAAAARCPKATIMPMLRSGQINNVRYTLNATRSPIVICPFNTR